MWEEEEDGGMLVLGSVVAEARHCGKRKQTKADWLDASLTPRGCPCGKSALLTPTTPTTHSCTFVLSQCKPFLALDRHVISYIVIK